MKSRKKNWRILISQACAKGKTKENTRTTTELKDY